MQVKYIVVTPIRRRAGVQRVGIRGGSLRFSKECLFQGMFCDCLQRCIVNTQEMFAESETPKTQCDREIIKALDSILSIYVYYLIKFYEK